jgi:PAS domain S-box-containing protein
MDNPDLIDNQRMLETLMSNLPGMVYRCQNDPEWTVQYASEGTYALTGYRPRDLIGNRNIAYAQIVHPDDRQFVWEKIQEAIKHYSPYALVYRIIDASNIEKWVWEKGRGIFDENDRLLFLEGFIMDITEQKKAEESLSAINTRLKVLINATPDMILFKDAENRWMEANAASLALFELDKVDYRGKTNAELARLTNPIYKPALEKCHISDETAWKSKKIGRGEEVIPQPDGKPKIFDVLKAPIINADGEREGLVVFGRDISEQKKAQEELRISEQTYQGILGSVTEAVYIQDENGVFLDINHAAEKLYGYDRAEVVGKTPLFLSAPGKNDFDRLRELIQKAYEGQPQRFEFWGKKKNGETFPKEVSVSQGWYFGKKAIIAVARDITGRKRAERALKKRLEELEAFSLIDRTISSSFDLKTTFEVLLKQAIAKLGVDAAAIALFDPDLQSLKYTAAQGFYTSNLENITVRPGQGLPGKAMLERQLVSVVGKQELYNDKWFAKLWLGEDFQSYYGIPLVAKGQVKGVLEVFDRSELSANPDWLNFFETISNQTAIAIDNTGMFERLQHANMELALAYDATIEGWAHALELREGESPGHITRIIDLTIELAQALGLPSSDMISLRRGVLLHDIGKMGIPDKILLKKGLLTRAERKIIEQHPSIAHNLLARIDYLKHSINIPLYHHEKWDGSGYPEGLSGRQIPYHARIFAVIDVWDALTNDRPHRKAWSREEALNHIREQSGKHFDPQIAEAFLKLMND